MKQKNITDNMSYEQFLSSCQNPRQATTALWLELVRLSKPENPCDCYSYNWDIGSTPECIADPRPFFLYNDGLPESVSLDSCIADTIMSLWQRGLWTLNSCCGHNRDRPSVVVDSSVALSVKDALYDIDPDRNWRVLCWQLREVDVER